MSTINVSTDTLPGFIQRWKDSVESGKTPEQVASECYHPQAVLKGTIWGKAVRGPDKITDYFTSFVTGRNNIEVVFQTIKQSPAGSFAGEYTFKWVDENGAPQSTEANYTFEPIQNSEGKNVISLHHSSFLPPETNA